MFPQQCNIFNFVITRHLFLKYCVCVIKLYLGRGCHGKKGSEGSNFSCKLQIPVSVKVWYTGLVRWHQNTSQPECLHDNVYKWWLLNVRDPSKVTPRSTYKYSILKSPKIWRVPVDNSVTKAKVLVPSACWAAPFETFADHYIGRRRLEAVAEILADVATMLRT